MRTGNKKQRYTTPSEAKKSSAQSHRKTERDQQLADYMIAVTPSEWKKDKPLADGGSVGFNRPQLIEGMIEYGARNGLGTYPCFRHFGSTLAERKRGMRVYLKTRIKHLRDVAGDTGVVIASGKQEKRGSRAGYYKHGPKTFPVLAKFVQRQSVGIIESSNKVSGAIAALGGDAPQIQFNLFSPARG
jgi:hypothetical protein